MTVRPQITSTLLMFLLLCSALLAVTLQGVQGEAEVEGPSESECRPYIEKALRKLETGDTPSAEIQEENIVTTEESNDDSDKQSEEQIETVDADASPSVEENINDGSVEEIYGSQEESKDSVEATEISKEETKESGEEEQRPEENTDNAEAETTTVETVEADNEDSETGAATNNESEDAQKAEDENEASVEGADSLEADESKDGENENTETVTEDSSEKDISANVEPGTSAEEGASAESVAEGDGAASAEADEATSIEVATSAEDTVTAEETASAEDTATAEEAISTEEATGAEDAASVDETASAEEVAGADEAASTEAAASAEATDSAEAAVSAEAATSAEATASAEDATSAENAASTEEATTAEDAASAEEATGAEGAASAEEAVTGEETTSAEEAVTAEDAASAEEPASVEEETTAEDAASAEDAVIVNEAASAEDADSANAAASAEEVSDSNAEASAEADANAEEAASVEQEASAEEAANTEQDTSTENVISSEQNTEAETGEQADQADSEKSSEQEENANTDERSESEGKEEKDPVPVEDLTQEFDIPTDLRPRDHINQILELEEESTETEKLVAKAADVTLRELKRLYENAIKPLEVLYKYRDLSNRHFGDPEIFSKPLVLFMGPWSGGKSSIVNYLLDNEYKHTSLRTGAEPSPAYFNILMHGEEPEVLDGTQLAADWTFSGLQKFGQGLEERLRGLKLPNKLLEKINIVEIPGILEVRKQVSRMFPFNDACQWFIDRADIIFLVYDPSKLDVGPETEAILDQLKGREYQTRIILNKADQVKPEELMRVQGALIWNISPLMSSAQPPVMYTTSLWSRPYEVGAPVRLLQAQERAFLKDLKTAVDKRIDNKISSARRFAVRVRNHAKMVDCYLTTYYNHKSVFGNKKQVSDQIIEHPQDYHIYEGLSTLTNISRYDLPDPDVYRDFFRLNPLYDFQQLSATCTYFRGCPINRLDVAIAYDLPELVGKYKKMVESANTNTADSTTTKS